MKKKLILTTVIFIALIIVMFIFSSNPIVSCKTEVPMNYMEAIENQSRGIYSKILPLVPVYVSVNSFSDGKVNYTIYYFPFGTVDMSYTEDDGYNIEKALTGL